MSKNIYKNTYLFVYFKTNSKNFNIHYLTYKQKLLSYLLLLYGWFVFIISVFFIFHCLLLLLGLEFTLYNFAILCIVIVIILFKDEKLY